MLSEPTKKYQIICNVTCLGAMQFFVIWMLLVLMIDLIYVKRDEPSMLGNCTILVIILLIFIIIIIIILKLK
jgi:hypothetical protein